MRTKQLERAALEGLARDLQITDLRPGQRYFIGTEEVFLHEISCASPGSKSDLAQAMFAVFGRIPGKYIVKRPVRVSGCALTRCMDSKERDGRNEAVLVFEALRVDSVHSETTLFFGMKGKKEEYQAPSW